MNYLEIANSLGVPVAMLVFMCAGATWIIRRVFGSGGLGTKLVAAHVMFLHRLEELTEAILEREHDQLNLLQKAADTTAKCYELHTKPDALFATAKLHRAGLKFTRLCEIVLKQTNVNGEAQQVLADIRRDLEA